MKGISFVTDDNNKRVAVQIALKVLEKYDSDIEDLLDGIIAESRKEEPRVALESIVKDLKKKGRLR